MTEAVTKTTPKEEVLEFIRERLSFKHIAEHMRHVDKDVFSKEHLRFDMSGYESQTGECTVSNQAILNKFADLGIYDYTHYLVLDFYKGSPTIYLRYWGDNQNIEIDDLSGYGTTEIMYRIFELTIFTDRRKRRRI